MTDLVKRHIEQLRLTGGDLADMCQPLADAIEALQTQNFRLSGMCYDLNKEVAISDALLISEAQASLERLARAEKAEADNARLRDDKDGLQAQIASLLNLCDGRDKEWADAQNGGLTMHAYGMSPDWYVEAAFWSCYGFSPNDPRAAITGKEPSHD